MGDFGFYAESLGSPLNVAQGCHKAAPADVDAASRRGGIEAQVHQRLGRGFDVAVREHGAAVTSERNCSAREQLTDEMTVPSVGVPGSPKLREHGPDQRECVPLKRGAPFPPGRGLAFPVPPVGPQRNIFRQRQRKVPSRSILRDSAGDNGRVQRWQFKMGFYEGFHGIGVEASHVEPQLRAHGADQFFYEPGVVAIALDEFPGQAQRRPGSSDDKDLLERVAGQQGQRLGYVAAHKAGAAHNNHPWFTRRAQTPPPHDEQDKPRRYRDMPASNGNFRTRPPGDDPAGTRLV